MILAKLNINTRLIGAFGLIVAILLALIVTAKLSQNEQASAQKMNIHTYHVMEEANALLTSLINIETGARGYMIAGTEQFLEPLTKGRESFSEHWNAIKELTADNPAQQRRLDNLKSSMVTWLSQAVEPGVALRRDVAAGSKNMDAVVAYEREARGKSYMDGMRREIADIIDVEAKLLEERSAAAAAAQRWASIVLIGGGSAAVLLSLILAVVIARSIVEPLRQILRATEDLRAGEGDLTYRLPSMGAEFGEISASMNGFIQKLQTIIASSKQETSNMSAGVVQISTGNDDLSQRTQEQAAALEETASSMEQMTATVKQNADNARQANQLSANARAHAEKGGAVVKRVVSAMEEINASSRQIADIISVIDEIAFQTNLLALNAAVEAARAGEQGRGFAVVATEVRSLAQRSATAAKEIKDLIGNSVQKVRAGSELVDESGKTLDDIMDAVKKVSDIVAEIAAASAEQASGIEQVNNAVSQMDATTQQNAALVEEASAASKSLEERAHALVKLMSQFRTGDERLVATVAAAPARVASFETHKKRVGAATSKRSPEQRASTPIAKASGDGMSWQEF
jgi:methyl-accepting chemotaxis protein